MAGSLLHSPADIIRYLMVAQGYGSLPSLSSTWPISVGRENKEAESTITVYDDEGRDRGRIMNDGSRPVLEGYQIRFRSTDPKAAFLKARATMVAMDALYLVTVPIADSAGVRRYYTVHSINRGLLINLSENLPTSSHGIYVCNCLSSIKMAA